MYRWVNNFFTELRSGGSQDFLQLERQSDGAILGWIDEDGIPRGSLNVPSTLQATSSPYTITDADVALGYASVPVTWPTPFGDANYVASFSIGNPENNLEPAYAAGDIQSQTAEGFVAIVNILAPVPLIQGQLQVLDTNQEQSVTFPVLLNTVGMYMITFYLDNYPDVGDVNEVSLQASWTDPSGGGQSGTLESLSGPYPSNIAGTFPVLVAPKSNIVVNTVFSAAPFHYDIGVYIVRMPDNQISLAGDTIQVMAMGVPT